MRKNYRSEYADIINHVYIAEEKDVKSLPKNLAATALPVTGQKGSVYVYAILSKYITFVAPLRKEDLQKCNKTVAQFETDYRPKSFSPLLAKIDSVYF